MGALGDAARDDRRDRGREGAEEEELDQLEALRLKRLCAAADHVGALKKRDAVGDAVADEEVGDRRDREVDQDLDQRVDLVLVAHGADFEEREAAVHGEHQNRADQ